MICSVIPNILLGNRNINPIQLPVIRIDTIILLKGAKVWVFTSWGMSWGWSQREVKLIPSHPLIGWITLFLKKALHKIFSSGGMTDPSLPPSGELTNQSLTPSGGMIDLSFPHYQVMGLVWFFCHTCLFYMKTEFRAFFKNNGISLSSESFLASLGRTPQMEKFPSLSLVTG